MWVKLWHHANFQPFQSSFVVLFSISGSYSSKKVNAWKITNEVRKGWKLMIWLWMVHFEHTQSLEFRRVLFRSNELSKGWMLARYHHFTHIECANKLRGLRRNIDALRVQNEQSLSKYQAFIRKLVCYKGISIFWNYLNSRLFVCSKCTIQSHIMIFQSFMNSFVIFHAFTNNFEL